MRYCARDNKVLVTQRNPLTGKHHSMLLNIPFENFELCLNAWEGGELIQRAFPMLSADEREFIKTGITPEEWQSFVGARN